MNDTQISRNGNFVFIVCEEDDAVYQIEVKNDKEAELKYSIMQMNS